MSLINILHYVADNISQKNGYFQKYDPIAVKLKTGQVVSFTTQGEWKYCGIEDAQQKAFYIRIDPNIATAPGRQLTSSAKQMETTVNCVLVAYSFSGDKFNSILIGNKIREELTGILFNIYKSSGLGKEQSIKIQVDKVLIQEHDVFQQETGKPYEGGNVEFSAVSVSFKLKYITSEDRCFENCDVFSKYYNCNVPESYQPV